MRVAILGIVALIALGGIIQHVNGEDGPLTGPVMIKRRTVGCAGPRREDCATFQKGERVIAGFNDRRSGMVLVGKADHDSPYWISRDDLEPVPQQIVRDDAYCDVIINRPIADSSMEDLRACYDRAVKLVERERQP